MKLVFHGPHSDASDTWLDVLNYVVCSQWFFLKIVVENEKLKYFNALALNEIMSVLITSLLNNLK